MPILGSAPPNYPKMALTCCVFAKKFLLAYVMCEIEAILNCRPITKLTKIDIEDWRALISMSILTGILHLHSPVTEFSKRDMYWQNYK